MWMEKTISFLMGKVKEKTETKYSLSSIIIIEYLCTI